MSESFTTTELRTESTKVYNSVMSYGLALIYHRDRPNMILITEDHYIECVKWHKENTDNDCIEK